MSLLSSQKLANFLQTNLQTIYNLHFYTMKTFHMSLKENGSNYTDMNLDLCYNFIPKLWYWSCHCHIHIIFYSLSFKDYALTVSKICKWFLTYDYWACQSVSILRTKSYLHKTNNDCCITATVAICRQVQPRYSQHESL